MTNTINKVIRNGTEYEFNAVNGGVTSVNTRTGAVTGLAEDNAVVKLTGDQTVAGTKTFSTSPKVPSKTSDATNTGTAIATEAQVYKKANTSDVLTKTNTNSYTPSADYHPATKKYVDDKAYNAGPGIEIGTYNDYSAMKGPCPEGFHVPSKNEINSLVSILTSTFSMTASRDTAKTYLKMPCAGRRSGESSFSDKNTYGYYWACSIYNSNSADELTFSSNMFAASGRGRTGCMSIRGFKDSPIVPDSSWTTLYDGSSIATGAGIFHNAILGIISVSGDGTTWITIQDKNLGATTVYNDGDTLSEANCGGYFQWGNNYMFPFTGSVTTSSTQVDASNYGPGNYYSSSIYISSGNDWSSVRNDNLWGATTGVITIDNAISNTGVLSVNGETGDVTVTGGDEATGISTTQPSSPSEGSIYYDTTDDVLKTYDGSQWNEVGGGKNYNAGKGIAIGDDYSALKGPCAEGYHIMGSHADFNKIKNILTTLLGATPVGTDLNTYLLLPNAGFLSYTTGNVSDVGTICRVWTRNWYEISETITYINGIIVGANNSSSEANVSYNRRGSGYPIRPVKDIPVVPDSSWTTLLDGSSIAEGAGVFHNPNAQIISLSDDGQDWITISDRNLGAKSTDITSTASYGKYYQRGNNYGFTSGSVTSTTTRVDASSYGPGNYYSSSNFIKTSNNEDWSTVRNDNLRGGVTGINKDAITNTLAIGNVENTSMGSFIKMMKQYGTAHSAGIVSGNNNWYKFVGYGYVSTTMYYGHACEINGVNIYYESFQSGTYTPKYPANFITMGPGDIVRIYKPGSNGQWEGAVMDYYDDNSVLPEQGDFLCFTANTANSTVQLKRYSNAADPNLLYSTDKIAWHGYTNAQTITLPSVGSKVYFRSKSQTTTTINSTTSDYFYFVMTGSIAASGDINYLVNYNSTKEITTNYCYYNLFKNCTALTSAPKLTATSVPAYGYQYMFTGCTGLTSTPEMSFTNVGTYGCQFMFQGCTGLTNAVLPNATLSNYCYNQMFSGCSSLTNAVLPSTELANNCYSSMFYNCTSLVTAPELPATVMKTDCYNGMFSSCTSLKNVPSLPAMTLAANCYRTMFYSCTSLDTLPELPATSLAQYCYYYMFHSCTKIKLSTTQTGEYQTAYRIPTTGTGTTASSALSYMFTSTGGTFAGSPTINTTYYTSNTIIPATS